MCGVVEATQSMCFTLPLVAFSEHGIDSRISTWFSKVHYGPLGSKCYSYVYM